MIEIVEAICDRCYKKFYRKGISLYKFMNTLDLCGLCKLKIKKEIKQSEEIKW